MLILVVLMFIVGIRAGTSKAMPPTPYFSDYTTKPLIIAHRGGAGERPGNTLVAFQHAVELGVDVLEMDVRLSADGHLVVVHDATVERTTDGQGAIAEQTLAQLQALDAAYHWIDAQGATSYRDKGVRIPTMEQVLQRFADVRLNVELKAPGPEAAELLCEQLRQHDATGRVLVASFIRASMVTFRGACPEVATSAHETEIVWFFAHYKLGLVGLYQPLSHALQIPQESYGFELASPQFFAAASRRGVHTDVWTINDAPTLEAMLPWVGGIITDQPTLALQLRTQLGAVSSRGDLDSQGLGAD